MNADPAADPADEPTVAPVDEAARRRRREQVFGEVLPESTSDDREPGAGRGGEGAQDEWLRSNVPPHHG